MRELPYTLALSAESNARMITMFIRTSAPGMPATSRTATNGLEESSVLFQGSTRTITVTAPT